MEMIRRTRILSAGLIAAFAVAGGTAWAITQLDDSGPDRPPTGSAPTTGTLAEGRAPSGGDYTISRLDPAEFNADSTKWFCTEIVTSASSTQGCHPAPDPDGRIDGQPLKPSFALLGTDRFFSILAPEGVAAMEVQIKGEDKAAAAQSIDAASGRTLLVATLGGPMVTSRDPSTSRDYEVRLLDPNGQTIREITMSDPGQGE